MKKKKDPSISHPLKDDLVSELAELKPLIIPEDHVSRIENKMLKVFKEQHRKNIQQRSSLSTWWSTIWEPSLVMIIFVFLSWDVFSIILYLLKN